MVSYINAMTGLDGSGQETSECVRYVERLMGQSDYNVPVLKLSTWCELQGWRATKQRDRQTCIGVSEWLSDTHVPNVQSNSTGVMNVINNIESPLN